MWKRERIRNHFADVLKPQPLARKPRGQRDRSRIRQQPPHLLLELRRFAEVTALGHSQQFLIWERAPQEEREARREVDVSDSIGLAWRERGDWRALETKEELRMRQHSLQRESNARLEVALRALLRVEPHEVFEVRR